MDTAAGGVSMPDEICNVVLTFEGRASRGNMKRTAYCMTHQRPATECMDAGADPFATLERLEAEALSEVKTCPHCGEPLERD